MTDAEERTNPIDKALDLGVFAPLGFALEFRRLVPELADAGRRQVAFSRSLGKAALSTITKAAAAKAASTMAQSPQSPQAPKTPAAKPAAKPAADKSAASKASASTAGTNPKRAAAPKPKPNSAKASTATKAKTAKKAANTTKKGATTSAAAVAGYDDLTAREIIALVADASPAQRSWMRKREQGAKKRKTVLQALDGA